MKTSKGIALDKAGWKVGSAEDFLELSSEERAFVEVKLTLAGALRKRREQKRLTQPQVASFSAPPTRVAMMEAGGSSVTVDLLVRSLFAIGPRQRISRQSWADGVDPWA